MEAPKNKLVHKRSYSALADEAVRYVIPTAGSDYACLLQQPPGSLARPGFAEDFHSFLAREGFSNHPWTTALVYPASDEDFVAYLARSSGINDTKTITKLRQVLEPKTPVVSVGKGRKA